MREQYHTFVDERARSFDADGALADILASEVEETGPGSYQVVIPQGPEGDVRAEEATWALMERLALHCEPDSATDPVDWARQLAVEMRDTLWDVRRAATGVWRAAHCVWAVKCAELQADELGALASELDAKVVTKEQALVVVGETRQALMRLYEVLEDLNKHSFEDRTPPASGGFRRRLKDEVFRLASETFGLQQAIRRLFEPADHTADALL